MARDNFQPTTINLLRKRAGGHCANPACRVATEGPGTDRGVGVVLGIAAHIKAASLGGPRYDEKMTKEQRRHPDNGIWLCTACATLVDRDEAGYPVSRLLEWRDQAEAWARSRLNRRPPSESEATALLASALAGSPASLSPRAIQNVHDATSQALQQLDPRFCVTSTFDGQRASFTLTPLEPIEVQLSVPAKVGVEWDRQLAGLYEHGEAATLPMTSVTATGSPLIEAIVHDEMRGGGKLRFTRPPMSLTVTLNVRDATGSSRRLFRGSGNVVSGQSTATVRTSLFHGAASFVVKFPVSSPASSSGTFTFGTDLLGWEGTDVRELAALDDLSEFAEGLASADKLEVLLHKGCAQLIGARIEGGELVSLGARLARFLSHALAAREIANGLGRGIRMALGPYSTSEVVRAREVADIMAGRRVLSASDLSSNPTCSVEVADDGALDQLISGSEPAMIRCVGQETSTVLLFGEEVELPPLEVTLEATRANVLKVSSTPRGKRLDIEWLREPDFRCTFRYVGCRDLGT